MKNSIEQHNKNYEELDSTTWTKSRPLQTFARAVGVSFESCSANFIPILIN